MNLLDLITALTVIKIGQVGRYGDLGDRLAGGDPACQRRLPHAEYKTKRKAMCAHRTLPCGTPILIVSGKQSTVCYVLDRGPYTRKADGSYRSVLDLSPAVADRIGLTLYIGRTHVLYSAIGVRQ